MIGMDTRKLYLVCFVATGLCFLFAQKCLAADDNSMPVWMLDAKKAKTLNRLSNDKEIILRRSKRWNIKSLWGEEQEEEEEECQPTCWREWGSWSSCSVRCGLQGIRSRLRNQRSGDCHCRTGASAQTNQCGRSCRNGGTLRANSCSCPAGYRGVCCETRITCRAPGSPSSGSYSPRRSTHYYNNRINYMCDSGWELSGGNNERRCKNDGQWSGSMPRCTRVQCGGLVAPRNGNMSPRRGFSFETIVRFSCQTGYRLVGNSNTQCLANRRWSRTTPRCEKINCGDPGELSHGRVRGNNYDFEDTVSYICETGYTLVGSSRRECLANGRWNSSAPRCVTTECPNVWQIEQGSHTLTNGNYYGSVLRYQCNNGYFLEGNSHRTCQANARWSGSPPSCRRITCQPFGTLLNGNVAQAEGAADYGFEAYFSCVPGYRLVGNASATCEGSDYEGGWSTIIPHCQAVECNYPVRPLHGKWQSTVSGTLTYQSTIELYCTAGYFVQGAAVHTCNENGQWDRDGEASFCSECPLHLYKSEESSATSCTRCPDNSHTVSTTSTSLIQCICDTGYQGPDGGPCTVVTCPELLPPENGVVDRCEYVYASKCTMRCNAGFIVGSGSHEMECQATGTWRGEALDCLACPQDTYQFDTYSCRRCPDNSVTSREASVLSNCTCNSGFQMNSTMSCRDVDECSENPPCQQECVNTVGSFRCECLAGWNLNGHPDDNPTQCTASLGNCTASELESPPNGGYICGVDQFEKYCSAYCNPEYEFLDHTDSYISCTLQTGWQWSLVLNRDPPPVCTKVLFGLPSYTGTATYFGGRCSDLTEAEKNLAETKFIEKLEETHVCRRQEEGNCQLQNLEIRCGEEFDENSVFGRRKRQTSTGPLVFLFSFMIASMNVSTCSGVNCVLKYDRLIEFESERISLALEVASRAQGNNSRCALCLTGEDGQILKPNVTGNVRVRCEDGQQRKGYSCRQCGVGMFHNKQTGLCELCPAGEYQPHEGQTSCLSCPYLTASGRKGATKCPLLPEDTFDCQTRNPCLLWIHPGYKRFFAHKEPTMFVHCTGQQKGNGCSESTCPGNLIWDRISVCINWSQIPLSDIY